MGYIQTMGSQRVGYDQATNTSLSGGLTLYFFMQELLGSHQPLT